MIGRAMIFRDELRQTVLAGLARFAEAESAATAGARSVRPEKRVKGKLRAAWRRRGLSGYRGSYEQRAPDTMSGNPAR